MLSKANTGALSTSTLRKTAFGYFSTNDSKTGATLRHGPHLQIKNKGQLCRTLLMPVPVGYLCNLQSLCLLLDNWNLPFW